MAIPPYFPGGNGAVFTDTSGAEDFDSDSISVAGYVYLSFFFTWEDFNQTDATVTLECSNDGTNWDEKDGANFTIGAAAGTQGISLNGVVTEAYYRVVFDHGTNSAGTITCIMVGKNPG